MHVQITPHISHKVAPPPYLVGKGGGGGGGVMGGRGGEVGGEVGGRHVYPCTTPRQSVVCTSRHRLLIVDTVGML